MPIPSASQRVKEILARVNGNRSQAERLIRETIARDPKFLRQLVDPFLPGIIAHALSRMPEPEIKRPIQPLPEESMNALLRGLESNAAAAPARPAGQGHADTIRALAQAHKQRRDKF